MGEPNEGGEQRQKGYKKGRDLDKAFRLATNVYSGHRKVGEIVRMADTRLLAWSSRCRTLRLLERILLSHSHTLSHCAAGGGKVSSSARALHDHVVCRLRSSGMHSGQHAEGSARRS